LAGDKNLCDYKRILILSNVTLSEFDCTINKSKLFTLNSAMCCNQINYLSLQKVWFI